MNSLRISKQDLEQLDEYSVAFHFMVAASIVNSLNEQVTISIKNIEDTFGELSAPQKTKLRKFLDLKCADKKRTLWTFNKKDFVISKDFVELKFKDVQKIMAQKGNIKLIAYYARVLMSCNWKTHVGNQKMAFFVNKYELSKRTIIRYNEQLEDLELLYIVHASGLDNGANYYGAYKYKKEIDAAARFKGSANKSNNHRSMSAKYNQVKKGKTYSSSEMIQLAEFVQEHNSHENYNRFENPSYVPQLYDITLFADYL